MFPDLCRWTICARVTSKSSIREWSNSRGTGRLFNVDLIDESVSSCVNFLSSNAGSNVASADVCLLRGFGIPTQYAVLSSLIIISVA